MSIRTPKAEQHIDEALVRDLLREQQPALADAPITALDVGWDNALFRLGDEHVVRLPRRAVSVQLIDHETTWLPRLADRLPIAVPTPVYLGRPGCDYPWPWTVLPWLPGRSADLDPPDATQAERFADFLLALHQPAPDDAPRNPFRGVPLAERAERVEQRMDELRQTTDAITPNAVRAWRNALDADDATTSCWLHGDLHARNVLVQDGEITGVIDWGDITSGDAATDLAGVWSLFDNPAARRAALDRYQPTDDQLARAKGWAVSFGVMLLATGLTDHPQHAAMGAGMLQRVSEDDANDVS